MPTRLSCLGGWVERWGRRKKGEVNGVNIRKLKRIQKKILKLLVFHWCVNVLVSGIRSGRVLGCSSVGGLGHMFCVLSFATATIRSVDIYSQLT